jgi:hypothetical protein
VGSKDDLPMLPDGECFDHLPVSIKLPVLPSPPLQQVESGEPVRGFKWIEAAKRSYTDVLEFDGTVLQCFHDVFTAGDSRFAAKRFNDAIMHAVGCLGDAGYTVVKRVHSTTNTAPRNGWYNNDCQAARWALNQAIRQSGYFAPKTRVVWREYKAAVRKAKTAFAQQRTQDLLTLWHAEPYRFWRQYQGGAGGPLLSDIGAWTQYFHALLAGTSSGTYHGGSLSAHCAHFADSFPEPPTALLQAAGVLNECITESEVIDALKALVNRKAAGVDGLPAEFLKYATRDVHCDDGKCIRQFVLAPMLTRLFNLVLQGSYPEDWATCALAPVPKPKGDPTVRDNHRGIAIGPALGKLYSLVLLNRLDAWAERSGLRAAGQAGFRKGRATIDNVFILQHIIERYAAQNKAVYCAFIDFRKAYDCVDRGLLWRALQAAGLQGPMFNTLMGMYDKVCMQVRLGGKLGERFATASGVRQGDPLSPLLFGLFIDRFECFLKERHPGLGCKLDSHKVLQQLLYADDIVLFAESAAELQAMLDCLAEFCAANLMVVNVPKSEVVVFNSMFAGPEPAHWTLGGAALKRSSHFVYLGVLFEDGAHLRTSLSRGVTKGRAAMFALIRRCHELGLHRLDVKCQLWKTLVAPIISYGCEVWGVYHWADAGSNAIQWGHKCSAAVEHEQLQITFLRGAMGVAASTPLGPLMREAGMRPVLHSWIEQTMGFYTKIAARPTDDLVRIAMAESIGMASQGIPCWGTAWLRGMNAIDNDIASQMQDHEWPELSRHVKRELMEVIRGKWLDKAWASVPRALPEYGNEHNMVRTQYRSDGFQYHTYNCWFAGGKFDADIPQGLGFKSHIAERHLVTTMARFRLGCTWLNVDTQRWAHRARCKRICTCCAMQAVEDAAHIFECPVYADLRHQFHDVVQTVTPSDMGNIDLHMFAIMNKQQDSRAWHRLALFLYKSQAVREANVSNYAST